MIEEREVEQNEITERLKKGESPVFLAFEFGYNAVVKACHTRKARKKPMPGGYSTGGGR